ncbi:PAS domain-containing protein [Aureococcus anophagefferens]|nr:PAS domain-containing protein [Aureococcus anophagefferens]
MESTWAATYFALTLIRWLASAEATARGLVLDAATGKLLADFAAEHGSPLTQTHVQFAREAADVLRDDLESKASKKQLRKLHLRMRHNPIFYCTRTEIVIGDIDETAWEPIRKEVAWGLDVSTKFLAADLLPRVLRSETGRSIVEHVRRQELESAETHLHTCAHGVSTETSDERYWLDMFSGVASSLEDVGVVVSDMRVPGIPLVAINEPGFRNQTGYGPEQIGKKCTFLQGPETEQYLIDEIVDALRECKGLAVKLTNVKKDGSAFQCYLALHPVFGANGEYLYQVGAQVDMTGRPSDVCAQLKTLELLLQLLPSSILCRSEADMQRGVMALSASGDTSALALPSPPPVDALPEKTVTTSTVQTATGENRDMYGKRLGEKHASALRKLNKSAWLTDADRSMRVLLGREDARAAFKSFLASEYNEQALDFYLEAQKLVKLAPNQQASEAQRLLDTYMGAAPPKKGSRGIGQQDRTKATSTLWDGAKKGAFPRFVQSSDAKSLGASLAGPDLAKVRDADEWLSAFTQIAETWPACIVVSDMTIPGAPMVYVNPEFCRVTEYTSKEAVGRNCRFLQGPDTESESFGVIQRTLGKGEDCHVLLTNYRKSGEKFKNLLSMRPVFDADDVYRYVIGVQFEVVEVEETRAVEMTEEHCVASMFATTKLKWLSKPAEAVRGLVSDPETAAALERFAASKSPLGLCAVKFLQDADALSRVKGRRRDKLARKLFMRMWQNPLFYCTTTEIVIGDIDTTDWAPILKDVKQWSARWQDIVGECCLRPFLDSEEGARAVLAFRERERSAPPPEEDEAPLLSTSALGLDARSGTFWLGMVDAMSASMADVGLVVSDMRVPGIPLCLINEGFEATTGYGKDMVGQKCSFLQGAETPTYLIEEIVDALRGGESLVVKLPNYKRDGESFQCLLTLKPVFDAWDKYSYCVGAQVDLTDGSASVERLVSRLLRLSDVGRVLPEGMGGKRFRTDHTEEVVPSVRAVPVRPKGTREPASIGAVDGGTSTVKKSKKMKGVEVKRQQALARQMWLADSLTSLRSLIARPGPFRDAFRKFLETEQADAELAFYLGVLDMRALDDADEAGVKAEELHGLYLADVGDGIGQQQRTKATQRLWATARKKGNAASGSVRRTVEKEAERTLQSLAFDAFPRFLKTDLCSKAMKAMKKSGGNTRAEAVGRNCRFLQGPDTEPESIQVIQETLCKGEDCHVLLTNYRKSGDKFKNLLSMRPVYDADDVYRYTIGVQFEVEKDNSPAKLQQLNKLLQMLPKKLNLRSAKVARDRGLLAARTDGGANDALTAPTEVEVHAPKMESTWAATYFALTRIRWLASAEATARGLVLDAATGKLLADFAAEHGSPLTQTHVQFAREAADVLRDDLESKASKKQLRKLHLRMRHNPIFYCTRTEIVIGDIDETAWEPIRKEVAWGLDELESAETHLHTCAHGVSTETSDERYWLDMFGVAVAEDAGRRRVGHAGARIPLVAINEPGFRNQTGYGPEQIGKKCTFLQGPETEQYLIDEIVGARECKGLAVKLTNVKKDGSAFQCYLALHPVFGANGEYLYQVGAQVDMTGRPSDVCAQLKTLELLLQLLPSSILCRSEADMQRGVMALSASGDTSALALPSPPPVDAPVDADVRAAVRETVETATGENRDMYGKKLGEKHASALRKLNKSAWLTDADRSMRVLLGREDARAAFKSFLASEYNEQALDFYLEAQKLVKLAPNQQASEAQRLLDTYMGAAPAKKGSRGIGQQDRTKATSTLWDGAKKGSVKSKTDAYVAVQKEAQNTFKMLVVDSFPRFVQSSYAKSLGASLAGPDLAKVRDTDEWLGAFTQIAETWPACIVVSDMTIPGAPMVYVNPEFCRVTEYTTAEAVGRNCRFLQGPDTEPESIGVIQRTLGKCEDCHVLLTNYRKSGEKFKNLLSMRPVLDADDVYRFVIGVQFEVIEDDNLPMRLGQLDAAAHAAEEAAGARGTRKVEVEETRAVEMTEALRGVHVRDDEAQVALEARGGRARLPVFDAWDKYSYCVGAQVDLTDASVPVDRLVSRLLRLSDVGRVLPEGMGGKRFRTDHTEEVVASVRNVAPRMRRSFDSNAADDVWDSKSVASNEQKFVEPKHAKKSKKMKIRALKKEKALAQQMWLADSLTSLRSLIAAPGPFRDAFRKFLETEQADAELAFYLGVLDMRALDDADEAGVKAEELHGLYLADVGDGIGQQQRTKATQRLWTAARKKGNAASGKEIRRAVEKEAERTLQSLAFDAFPRFLKTDLCSKAMKAMKQSGGKSATDAALADNLEKMGSMAPQDADEWLSSFISFAETWPACIVVSDMTIPGAPMVYVNPEFCRVTEYPREEAVGRNCRFLQGPDTEPESIQVIQETLCKGEDCHVLLTNYRKSGDKFKNLLSMRPVYDADDVYRYTIGVQFEVEKDNSPAKLQQLNKLLQMLPKKLNLRSAKVARDRGRLAARTDGGANGALVAEKEERRHGRKDESEWAASIFALTRIRWLASAVATVRGLVQDAAMGKMLADFAAEHGSPLTQTHVQFAREAADVLRDDLESKASKKQLRKLHLRMRHNPIFYCTRTEIVIGDIDETAWEPIRKEVAWGLDVSTKFLAADLLPRVLRSETGRSIVEHVRRQEQIHETQVIHTCAHGVSTETSDERYWLDMFSGVASSLEDVGVVVSDMRVPGIQLVAINEPGFRNQTGYGPEQIGKKCTFLQGPETEQYLIDEIVARASARASRPLAKVRDTDEWLSAFTQIAETWPACIVVSDMTIPGAPMVYVNPEFCRVTEYTTAEAVGRNCRFLQGPDTEPESIGVIQRTLGKCEDCHVLLTNYRKSGEKFKNLLSMRPVLDADDVYRFVIGVQFEVIEDDNLPMRLGQLDKLLRMLPKKLPVRGGTRKVEVEETRAVEMTESTAWRPCSRRRSSSGSRSPRRPCAPRERPGERRAERFAASKSPLGLCAVKFLQDADALSRVKGRRRDKLARKLFMRMWQNPLFYCTTTEIVIGDIDTTDWAPILKDVKQWSARWQDIPVFDAWDKYSYCVGAQVDLTDASVPVDRLVSRLRAMSDVGRVLPEGMGGKRFRTDHTEEVVSSVRDVTVVPLNKSGEKITYLTPSFDSDVAAPATFVEPKHAKKSKHIKGTRLKRSSKQKAMQEMRQSGGGKSATDAALADNLEKMGSMAPQDADEWLSSFITFAETWPACIVVSDMTIPGAPMVYVNPEFCRVTEYPREEAVGRNCRFLQGPDTEPESIQVIQETLCKGEDCHVLLTNYRKSGDKFKNLLSMRPVYDADDVYRYTIGVQFEVEKDNSPAKLQQLNKLLQMLPKKLNLRSAKVARDRGLLAARTDGGANGALVSQPSAAIATPKIESSWSATVFALTRIRWLASAEASEDTVRGLVQDAAMGKMLADFAAEHGSPLTQTHVQFAREAADVLRDDLESKASKKQLRKLHLRMRHNPIFYCTRTEIVIGDIDETAWEPIRKEVAWGLDVSTKFLAADLLPRVLRSETGRSIVEHVRHSELKGLETHLHTCAHGVSTETSDERYWLDMFSGVASSLEDVGVVVSDMRVPGIPLVAINEPGFRNQTGYGPEQIGKKCTFLQGPETEQYLIDEIVDALRECKGLAVKLTNVKKDGSAFQCYLALHPVFGANGEYLYQVGAQVDMTGRPSDRGRAPRAARGRAARRGVARAAVRTAAGEDRDMYGKKLGKKHADALLKLNESAWLTDADASLRALLSKMEGRAAFTAFLATEYNEQSLDFVLEAQKLSRKKLNEKKQVQEAQVLYDKYLAKNPGNRDGSRGIGQADRTRATGKLWEKTTPQAMKLANAPVAADDLFMHVLNEADDVWRMLIVDSFPRFVASKHAASMGTIAHAALAQVRDTDEWLGAFAQIAETWPACIVVSDMTIPGAPMVYVNPEFCRVTEYTTEEAVGRNCRFLQGPDTEPESIGVIQRTLGKCEDCHVLLTNYRKSGKKFKNLLSMRPVLDADDVYRFVIGVQFEVIEDDNLPMRLGQLDKLLRMLPKKLPVRGGTRKVEVEETRAVEMTEEHCVASMFATTKLKWLSKPAEAVRGLASDPESAAALERFAEQRSPLALCAVKFLQDADALERATGRRRSALARKLFMRMWQNPLFYCTTTEIVIGDIDTTDWAPILKDVKQWSARWQDIVGECCLRPFLDSEEGARAVLAFRERERSAPPPEEDEAPLLSTTAMGLDARSGTFWLGMVDAMSASVADVGLVVSDMRVPGIPLCLINEGFEATTGYGKDMVGQKCSFLQGAETPTYLIEEIVDALRGGESLVVKLPNYKRDGSTFQCLLTLQPVFDAQDTYCYCVGLQVDLTDASAPVDRLAWGTPREASTPERRAGAAPLRVDTARAIVVSTDDEASVKSLGGFDEDPYEDDFAKAPPRKGYGEIGDDGAAKLYPGGPRAEAAAAAGRAANARPKSAASRRRSPPPRRARAGSAGALRQARPLSATAAAPPPSESSKTASAKGRFGRPRRPSTKNMFQARNTEKLVASPRTKELMETYGATAMDDKLVDGRDDAMKMQRCLEEMIDDELTAFRSVVEEHGALSRCDSETIGTRTSCRSDTLDLNGLKNERLLMQRLGFVEHVYALDERIKFAEDRQKADLERRQKEQRDRRMRMLVATHARRLTQYEADLADERATTIADQGAKALALAEKHRVERDEFVERTLRTATLHDVSATACACPNRYVCRHNRTASYKLRKRNPLVIKYRNAARKLRKSKRPSEAAEFEAKAQALDRREAIAWTKRVQESALRTKLPLLIAQQEKASKTLRLRHEQTLCNMDVRHRNDARNLERVLECERSKAACKMIKIQKQQRSVAVDMDGTQRRSSRAAVDGVGAELPTGAMSANIRAAMLQAQEDAAEGRSNSPPIFTVAAP